MYNNGLSPEKTQILNEKFDIMLQELKNWSKRFEEKFLNVDKKSDSLESIITRLENKIAHLDSINSAFIRYETDGTDKIKILFDSDVDRKNHQDIYGHEFKRLNDLVSKNSFRISNLEQHFNQN